MLALADAMAFDAWPTGVRVPVLARHVERPNALTYGAAAGPAARLADVFRHRIFPASRSDHNKKADVAEHP